MGSIDEPQRHYRSGESTEDWANRIKAPTGRMVHLDKQDCRDTFGEDELIPETLWWSEASLGEQCGTYFRTSRVINGAVVWRWGGRDPEDVKTMFGSNLSRA